MMCPTDNNIPTKKKRGKKKKDNQYKKGKEIISSLSASATTRDDTVSTLKENFDDSFSTISYQLNSILTSTSTSTSTSIPPGPDPDEKRNEGEIKEEEEEDEEEDEEKGKIFNSDKQIYYRVVEKVVSNKNKNKNRNSVRKKKKVKNRKDKVEWQASVAGDTSSTTKINATCTDSVVDDQQNDCQDHSSMQTSTKSITGSVISYDSTGSKNSPDFSFRVLKEQRNSYMHHLMKKDGSNNSSSYQSTSSDGSDLSSVIDNNNNDNETSFNKPISRSELREDLTAQVRARFEIQDERVAEDVRASIRRAISKSGGLGIVDEEKCDDNDNDDGEENGGYNNTDKNKKDVESGNENNDNKEDDDDDGDEIVKTRRLKRLTDIIISRRGCVVFVAICVCLLLIGNILLIVLWALNKN
jgi:hypothetical protein